MGNGNVSLIDGHIDEINMYKDKNNNNDKTNKDLEFSNVNLQNCKSIKSQTNESISCEKIVGE